MADRRGDGWNGYIEGISPVQGCGSVDGYPWYFRARGDTWWFEIAEERTINEEALPIVGTSGAGWLLTGVSQEAGHMSEHVAWGLVEDAIRQFRSNKMPYLAPKNTLK